MRQIILIRHPEIEPEWKLNRYGTMDVSINAAGLTVSKLLADAWPDSLPPTRIYHSGLKRTKFLARMIADHFSSAPIVPDSRLREWEFGRWQEKVVTKFMNWNRTFTI